MDEQQLSDGMAQLDRLCQAEYKKNLADLIQEADKKEQNKQLGRLVGVFLKEPFANPKTLTAPSPYSGAYRTWQLVDRPSFDRRITKPTWQLEVVQRLQMELGIDHKSPYEFIDLAHHEAGFFAFFAEAIRKYICGDPKIRKKVEKALKSAGKAGDLAAKLTPEHIVGAGGVALGTVLVQHVPLLGLVGSPVIAALVVILYTLGMQAFCKWTDVTSASDEKD